MLHPFRICIKFEDEVVPRVIGSKAKGMGYEVVIFSKGEAGEGGPNSRVDA